MLYRSAFLLLLSFRARRGVSFRARRGYVILRPQAEESLPFGRILRGFASQDDRYVSSRPAKDVILSPKGEESPDGVRESVASFFLTMYLHRELLSV
jgi:hypothetical protein